MWCVGSCSWLRSSQCRPEPAALLVSCRCNSMQLETPAPSASSEAGDFDSQVLLLYIAHLAETRFASLATTFLPISPR
jgi:hypothetical protein